jgi:pimeloyl-ACP methyl ester carboxylesterase
MDRLFARTIARAGAVAGAAIDRGVLKVMARAITRGAPAVPSDDARRLLIDMAAHYRREVTSLFIAPELPRVEERIVGERHGGRVVDIVFDSEYSPTVVAYREEHARYRENLTVHARLFTGPEPAPTAILVHGWAGGAFWFEERAFAVHYLRRIGLDVALVQLPVHGRRAPAQSPISGSMFPGPHVVRTNESFGQAISDLRALARVLAARGAPAVGVIGASLGGYTSALWAALDDDLAFCVPMIPFSSLADMLWRHGEGAPLRRWARKAGIDAALLEEAFSVHAPLERPVKLPRERLMIVAGRGDAISFPDHAEALWEHWGRPTMHWFAGGHLAQLGRGNAFRAIRTHLVQLGLARPPSRA